MHSCQDIEENRCFSNGGTNWHIHAIAQGRPEDDQVEFLQGPHGIVNPPKNIVLNNIRRFTMEHIGAANGLAVSYGGNRVVIFQSQSRNWGEIIIKTFVIVFRQIYSIPLPKDYLK